MPVDTDTNAGTLCAPGEYLNGDGTCYPVPVDSDTNTNAETICPDAHFLDGDGTCRPAISDWVIVYAQETLPAHQGHGLIAECPDGYVVMGGGYSVPINGSGFDLRSSPIEVLAAFPDANGVGPSGPLGWEYRIWYNNNSDFAQEVEVRAICAKSDW